MEEQHGLAEKITYGSRIYLRYPESPHPSTSKYFRSSGKRILHRDVWSDQYGPIPKGYHIHHIDGDTTNNHISNLECLSRSQHRKHHMSLPGEMERLRHLAAQGRIAAREWHKTDEAHSWHVAQGKSNWDKIARVSLTCRQCGTPYEAYNMGRNMFCSRECRAAYRQAQGIDQIERLCAGCHEPFLSNKYVKRKYCTHACYVCQMQRTA